MDDEIFTFVVGCIIMVVIIFLDLFGVINTYESNVEEQEEVGSLLNKSYDLVSLISCDTQSMGLGLRCNKPIYSRKISIDEKLLEGEIYIYQKNNSERKIIHRLTKCFDENCSLMVFRGDNNAVGEIVYRKQVIFKPVFQILE